MSKRILTDSRASVYEFRKSGFKYMRMTPNVEVYYAVIIANDNRFEGL